MRGEGNEFELLVLGGLVEVAGAPLLNIGFLLLYDGAESDDFGVEQKVGLRVLFEGVAEGVKLADPLLVLLHVAVLAQNLLSHPVDFLAKVRVQKGTFLSSLISVCWSLCENCSLVMWACLLSSTWISCFRSADSSSFSWNLPTYLGLEGDDMKVLLELLALVVEVLDVVHLVDHEPVEAVDFLDEVVELVLVLGALVLERAVVLQLCDEVFVLVGLACD